jgi:hypothetical protein
MSASVDGTELVSDVSVHVDSPPVHLASHPVGRVSFDHHFAPGHLSPEVHPGIAFDADAPLIEFQGNPLDASAIAFPDQRVVPLRRAPGIEERAQGFSHVAVQHLDRLHLFGRLLANGCQPHGVDFDRHARVIAECESEGHCEIVAVELLVGAACGA